MTSYSVKIISYSNFDFSGGYIGEYNYSTGYYDTGDLYPHTLRCVGKTSGTGQMTVRVNSRGTGSEEGTLQLVHPHL